jgi:hypothetical protein
VLDYNAVHRLPTWLRRLEFDAIVLHTTLLGMRWSPVFEQWKERLGWLEEVDALKIALPQDEYWHAETLDSWLDELGVKVVGTVLGSEHRHELYPRLSRRAAFYDVLTGYIDEDSATRMRSRLVASTERPYDVVYRARKLPYWLGSHGQLKHRVGEAAAELAPALELSVDISTRLQETVLGDAWLDFLGSGRATVGAESGSSTLDRGGELQARVEALVAREPDLTFAKVDARLPPGWDDYRFFAVSPRHLEAVVTKTAQILVEGSYSGVLEPSRHYIPIKRDLSDLGEALERLNDRAFLARLTDQAYADIYESGRFNSRQLTALLGGILREHGRPRRKRRLSLLPVAQVLSNGEAAFERTVVEPAVNVVSSGGSGLREVLAGLRLATVDPGARRLLVDYLRSTETREHVSPREALANLLYLGSAHRAKAGHESYDVSVSLDESSRKLLLRSHGPRSTSSDGTSVSATQLADLLEEKGWEFLWDHSEVGIEISYPLALRRSIRLVLPPSPARLPILDWLARSKPEHVVAALEPLLHDRRP